MNWTKFTKGLIMAVVGVLLTGMQTDPINWAVITVTAIVTILAYSGKNIVSVSVSDQGELNIIDILSGLFLGLSTALGNSIAMIVQDGCMLLKCIDWVLVLKISGGVALTYISTTFFAGEKK